jgi:hypothetical protein
VHGDPHFMLFQKFASLRYGLAAALLVRCDSMVQVPALSKARGELQLGDQIPRLSEQEAIGAVEERVSRQASAFRGLARNRSADIVFKDEEATGADRIMTTRLEQRLARLNRLVREEWGDVRVRVTEAWDENGEHGAQSAHYEGRAADLTTSDLDSAKLGRLAYLAVEAGFDWVYFEDRTHIHASVRKSAFSNSQP